MESVEGVESIDKIKVRVVGIDIRLDRTTYAIVDIKGDIVAQDQFDTMDFPDVNDFVSALSEKVIMLVEENGGYESIRSVGVSVPSANSLTGCVENAANLPWKGVVPLAAMLRDRLGLAVAVANDAMVVWVVVSIPTVSPIWAMMALLVRWAIPALRSMAVSVAVVTRDVWRPIAVRKV